MDMEGREEDLTTKKVRVYVGGLGEGVTSDDLCGTFSKMGVEIEAVDIIRTKGRSFAYIDFSHQSRDSLPKLFNTYNGCVWKGGRLRLEKAKEDYLDRLKREWDEDAQLARNTSTTNVDVNINNTECAEKLKKGITSEKKQLRVFFPKLRKVKSLPFTGTGKHKYSFRRVEVPPLPTYICDCEEHCGSLYHIEEKQIPVVEDQGGGMNKQEIELMNSVMHKLFEKEDVSSAAFNDVELTTEEDDSIEEIDDLQLDETEGTDDDNLIINVVSRGKETTRPNQDSKSNKRQVSSDGPTHRAVKKKTKINEENSANESVPTASAGEGSLHAQLNGSVITPGVKIIEPQSSVKQFGSSVLWSQKSSWRELVGDNSNNSITISDILPSTSSKKDKQRKSNTSPNFRDSKTKKSLMHEHQRDQLDKKVEDTAQAHHAKTDSASEKGGRDENKKLLMHEYQRDHLDEKVEDTAEAQPTDIDSYPEKAGRGENKKSLMREYQRDELDKNVEDTAEAQPCKPDCASEKHEYPRDQIDEKIEDTAEAHPSEPDSASDKHECQRDQLDEKIEDTAEAQPNKTGSASEKGGRGSAWLHNSSWTQLVASNTSSSFSITQILPGLAFDKQEPAKLDSAITANSTGNTHDDMIDKRESDSAFGASGLRIGSDRDVQRTTTPSQVLITDNSNAPAPTANTRDSATKQSLPRNIANVETFSFKRSDESLKEWAKIKAALSGTRKRTNKKK